MEKLCESIYTVSCSRGAMLFGFYVHAKENPQVFVGPFDTEEKAIQWHNNAYSGEKKK